MSDVVELPKPPRMPKKKRPNSARPPQGRMALIGDVPANPPEAGQNTVDALRWCVREAKTSVLFDGEPGPVAAELVATAERVTDGLRIAQVVEAKPGHYVIALPQQGTVEADKLIDACGKAVYHAQPWPTVNGAPPEPWERRAVTHLNDVILCKAIASAVLAAAGMFTDTWHKEQSDG